MPNKDIEARRAAVRKHYQSHKPQYLAKNQKKYEEIKAFLIAYKTGKLCMDCNQPFPYYVLDFDHRPGETKTKDVANLKSSSLQKVKTEIAKCDLVCANCHRERTHKRRISSVEE